MKYIVTFYLLNIAVFSFTQANWNNTSFVHQEGNKIVDGYGDTIQLNGVNLGGWLMWEGWIWGGNFTQEKTIYADVESKIGTAAADEFRENVYDNYITKADIKAISEQCYNVVRIPFNHKILEDDFTPYVYKPSGWARLDSVLAWCEEFNVYAILDLHSAPGGQSNSFTADPDLFINLWNGSINQERTARLWKAIADRYKNRGIIAGYDLLNEPEVASDSTLLAVYERIIDSVRTVDTNHMLFIEGNSFATDFSMFTTTPLDNNMTYEFHFYTWFFSFTIPEKLEEFTVLSDTTNVPIWCGEWGENDLLELQETIDLFRDPIYNVSGQAVWTWKKLVKPSGYDDYYEVDSTVNWNKTIRWIGNNSNPEPTIAEMNDGINDFLDNSLFINCELNTAFNQIVSSCADVGINKNETSNLTCYPNPVNDELIIESEAPILQLQVFSSDGKECGVSRNKNVVDVENLSQGIYFLVIHTNNKQETIKFIKE